MVTLEQKPKETRMSLKGSGQPGWGAGSLSTSKSVDNGVEKASASVPLSVPGDIRESKGQSPCYWCFVFIFIWLCHVFVAACVFSLIAVSGGYSLLWCAGFVLWWLLLLWSMGSREQVSIVVAHRLGCSAAWGIFPDQGSNLCPLHWQADS